MPRLVLLSVISTSLGESFPSKFLKSSMSVSYRLMILLIPNKSNSEGTRRDWSRLHERRYTAVRIGIALLAASLT